MNIRQKISLLLFLLGLILVFLPLKSTRTLSGDPEKLLIQSLDRNSSYSADQLAHLISVEDQSIRVIDLRSPAEFMKSSIPGSINVPYAEFLEKDPSGILGAGNFRNIFYSNGDIKSGYALVLAGGLGYKNCFTLRGGMNGWMKTIADTVFAGEKISARENAIFEARIKAGKLFSEMNALPDSLKQKYLESKKFNPRKLDGGCE